MELFLIAIGIPILFIIVCIRFILPREVRNDLMAELIHDGIEKIWELIFGEKKVRIVKNMTKNDNMTSKKNQVKQAKTYKKSYEI